ncbi:hypothetical protein GBF38_019036, partial [Nibea albiflora]
QVQQSAASMDMMAEEQRVKRTLTEEAKKRKGESERARSRRTRTRPIKNHLDPPRRQKQDGRKQAAVGGQHRHAAAVRSERTKRLKQFD